jgi:ribosomal protein S18 acetylase RimI-like enzyme
MNVTSSLLDDLNKEDVLYICKHLTLRQNSLMKDIILGREEAFGIKFNKYKKLISVANEGDDKVGASLILFNKNKTFIFLLFVPKRFRRMGIGDLLLSDGIKTMRGRGKSRVSIFAWDKKSSNFYSKYFIIRKSMCLNTVRI